MFTVSRHIIFFTAVSLLMTCSSAIAQVPSTISYQGMLLGEEEKPVPDGLHQITFRIYDQYEGGLLLHEELRLVAVFNGLFSTEIGPFAEGLFLHDPRWLAVVVDGGEELSRSPFTATPWALHAASASSLSANATGVLRSLNGVEGEVDLKSEEGIVIYQEGKMIRIGLDQNQIELEERMQRLEEENRLLKDELETLRAALSALILDLED